MGGSLINFPRETVEFLPVAVLADGVEVVEDVEFSVTGGDDRPSAWTAAVLLGGKTGLMVEGQEPGRYTVWARVTGETETPVINAGQYNVC